MKNLLCLSFLLIFTSSIALADDSERTCPSNAYLIEDRDYFNSLDYKKRTKFRELPEWIPVAARNMYHYAQSLPINAIPSEILSISETKPKIQKLGKVFQKYTWNFKDDGYEYQLSIYRHSGCVGELNLGLQKLKGADRTAHFFIQSLNIPNSGQGVFKLSKEKDACKIRTIKKQRFQYLKNGKVPPINTRDIPEYASMVFQLIDSHYNYKRGKVTNEIGLPTKEDDGKRQRWSLKDTDGSTFEVTLLSTAENCDKILKIEWIDGNGVKCSLIKENYY